VLTTAHEDDLDVDYLRRRATEMKVAERLEVILRRKQ
jgi:hypothetical protein